MPCTAVTLPGGIRAIVCGPRRKPARYACGAVGTQLCDWKVSGTKGGTCDQPVCRTCTHVPAPDKDLCPTHAAEWKARAR